MRSVLTKVASILFGLTIIAGLLYGVLWIFRSLGAYVRSLGSELGGDVITVGGAIIVASITVVFGQYLRGRAEIRAKLRERKIEIYDTFLTELFNRLSGGGETDDEDDEKIVEFLRSWQSKIVLR